MGQWRLVNIIALKTSNGVQLMQRLSALIYQLKWLNTLMKLLTCLVQRLPLR